jgi:TPR repeat protein
MSTITKLICEDVDYEDVDYEKTIQLYKQASNSGDSDAMFSLGVIYQYGKNINYRDL